MRHLKVPLISRAQCVCVEEIFFPPKTLEKTNEYNENNGSKAKQKK